MLKTKQTYDSQGSQKLKQNCSSFNFNSGGREEQHLDIISITLFWSTKIYTHNIVLYKILHLISSSQIKFMPTGVHTKIY